MSYTDSQLRQIFNKNPGSCYICNRQTLIDKHGDPYKCQQGGWQVDHANPKGQDIMSNWFPACYPCNNEKADRTVEVFRRWIQSVYGNDMQRYRDDMWRKYCS